MALSLATDLLQAEDGDAAARARGDPTNGATHYYARQLMRPPAWSVGRQPCARIGGHDFFKGIA